MAKETVKEEVKEEVTPTEAVKVEAVKPTVKELEDKIAELEKLVSAPVFPAVVVTPDPEKYEALKEVIAKYKEQSPVKYAIKKEALEAQLSALKPN